MTGNHCFSSKMPVSMSLNESCSLWFIDCCNLMPEDNIPLASEEEKAHEDQKTHTNDSICMASSVWKPQAGNMGLTDSQEEVLAHPGNLITVCPQHKLIYLLLLFNFCLCSRHSVHDLEVFLFFFFKGAKQILKTWRNEPLLTNHMKWSVSLLLPCPNQVWVFKLD